MLPGKVHAGGSRRHVRTVVNRSHTVTLTLRTAF